MKELATRILAEKTEKGTLSVFFMGQAGVVIKTSDGTTVAIDLYLSNCCERYFGFKRLMPQLLSSDELDFDIVCATHAHFDHFDPDSIPELVSADTTKLIAACDCKEECARLGIPDNKVAYLAKGDEIECKGISIKAFDCDHGELAPDALGLIIRAEGKCIYIVGDTCMRADIAKAASNEKPDLMFVPINGAFGNLNSAEAAEYASIVKPKLTVPCHYWNFAEHGGDPASFASEMKEKYPELPYKLMRMGELVRI